MMPAKKKAPPIKLVWFELATDWLASRPDLPEGVSLRSMIAIVGMVLRATRSETNEALLSVRWIERMAGVNHNTTVKALAFLEATGWLWWTQRSRNRVKVYHITIPSADTVSAPGIPSADTSEDSSADTLSTTPGTPVTPLEDLTKGGTGFCSNCEQEDGHSSDCAYRPFSSRCGCAKPKPHVAEDDNYGRCGHCTLRMPDSWAGWAA